MGGVTNRDQKHTHQTSPLTREVRVQSTAIMLAWGRAFFPLKLAQVCVWPLSEPLHHAISANM
jgi:hypothetical protein